jgi:Tfp pilus assembly protein PilO
MKKRHVIIITIILAITLVWLLVLMSPRIEERDHLRATVADTEKQLDDFRRIMFEFPDFFNSRKQLLEQKKHLLSKLYSKAELLKLFEQLTQTAKMCGLALVEISPSIEELLALNRSLPDESYPRPLDITVRLQGDLSRVGNYIEKTSARSFYQGTTRCVISNSAAGQKLSQVTYSFKAILGTIKDS